MKKTIAYTNICLLLLLFGSLNAQNDKSQVVGIWEFQTITSIYYSDPQETLSTNRDKEHQETLIFHEDGTFNYIALCQGIENFASDAYPTSGQKSSGCS